MAFDAKVVHDWDQSAQISYMIGVSCAISISANSKTRAKPQPVTTYHPYRESILPGRKISKRNIRILLSISDALVKK